MRKWCFVLAVLWLTLTSTALGQQRLGFEFGILAGVPTHQFLETDFSGNPGVTFHQSFQKPSFTAGPTVGVVVYDRIAIQLDALYKRVRFFTDETAPAATISSTNHGASWEFPLVFDYRFLHGRWRPYAGGGGVVGGILEGTRDTRGTFLNSSRTDVSSDLFDLDNQLPAYIVNAGIEWHRGHVVIRPEMRYTRWDDSKQDPKKRRDQVELLMGFSFR
jgi:hypothetical protein